MKWNWNTFTLSQVDKNLFGKCRKHFGEINSYLWTHSDLAVCIMNAKEVINPISPSPLWDTEWWISPAHPSQFGLSLAEAGKRIIRIGQKDGSSSSLYKGKIILGGLRCVSRLNEFQIRCYHWELIISLPVICHIRDFNTLNLYNLKVKCQWFHLYIFRNNVHMHWLH